MMSELTQKQLEKILACVEALDPETVQKLHELKQDDTYKPWEPKLSEVLYSIFDYGETVGGRLAPNKDTPKQTAFFNRFRTEQFAQYAAATDKINQCYFQWCEAHGYDPKELPSEEMPTVNFSRRLGHWMISFYGTIVNQFHFKTVEMATLFLKECRPYLDEYARTMGWMS